MTERSYSNLIAAADVPGLVMPALIRWVAEESAIFADESSPFRATFVEGDARLTVVVGGNATGKSLFHRLMQSVAAENGIEAGTVSIRERTGAGETPGSMRRAFMYGDESVQSTGSASVEVVQKMFRYADREAKPVCALLDEPEIGLSDGYAHAFGQLIGQNAASPAKAMCGTIVISHSRRLVRGLIEGLGARPGYVGMIGAPDTIDAWLDQTEEHSIDDLLKLKDLAHERFRAVAGVLKR